VLTIGYDYIRRGGKDYAVYAERLVQGGVFAHSRNPLYLGNILIVLGLALIASSTYVYLVGLPFFLLAYAAIIAAEEDYLRRKFGAEYEDYCRRVNRLWPDWTGFGKSVEDMEFSWRRVVKKEYNTTFVWLAMALGLKLWDLESLPGPVSTGAVVSYLGCSRCWWPATWRRACSRRPAARRDELRGAATCATPVGRSGTYRPPHARAGLPCLWRRSGAGAGHAVDEQLDPPLVGRARVVEVGNLGHRLAGAAALGSQPGAGNTLLPQIAGDCLGPAPRELRVVVPRPESSVCPTICTTNPSRRRSTSASRSRKGRDSDLTSAELNSNGTSRRRFTMERPVGEAPQRQAEVGEVLFHGVDV